MPKSIAELQSALTKCATGYDAAIEAIALGDIQSYLDLGSTEIYLVAAGGVLSWIIISSSGHAAIMPPALFSSIV